MDQLGGECVFLFEEVGDELSANVDGFIQPGLYCVGWARRGPSGTIGTNRDEFIVLRKMKTIDWLERPHADARAPSPAHAAE